jgi:hypothetical protein
MKAGSITRLTTSVTHSFGIDKHSRDALTGARPLARGWCYPEADWFSLTISNQREDTHFTWAEWDELVAHVESLREQSKCVVKLVPKEAA